MSETLAARQVDIGAALTDMWRSVLLFIPKAIAFIAILVIGWLVARFVLKIVDRVLERVGFDRAVERGGVGRALERTRYDASDILARLAYYAVLLFTLQFAFGVWGPNPISDLIASVVGWLPRAFVAIVIVVVAAAIATAVRDLITGALGGLSYGRLLATLASVFIVALGVIAALNQIGIATTVTTPVLVAVLATISGILIVGVGGGLIKPMQQRWEGWLDRAATESRVIRDKAAAYSAGQQDMRRQMADRSPAAATQDPERTQVIPRGDTSPTMTQGQPVPGGQPGSGGQPMTGDATRTQALYQSGSASPDGAGGMTQPGPGGESPRLISENETQRIERPRPSER